MISNYSSSSSKCTDPQLFRKESYAQQQTLTASDLKQRVKFLENNIKSRNYACSYQSSPTKPSNNSASQKRQKTLFNDENSDPIIQRIIQSNQTFVKEREDEIKNAKLFVDQMISSIEQIKLNEKLKLQTKIQELEQKFEQEQQELEKKYEQDKLNLKQSLLNSIEKERLKTVDNVNKKVIDLERQFQRKYTASTLPTQQDESSEQYTQPKEQAYVENSDQKENLNQTKKEDILEEESSDSESQISLSQATFVVNNKEKTQDLPKYKSKQQATELDQYKITPQTQKKQINSILRSKTPLNQQCKSNYQQRHNSFSKNKFMSSSSEDEVDDEQDEYKKICTDISNYPGCDKQQYHRIQVKSKK